MNLVKSFEEQNNVLVNFDKTFDSSSFKSCVDRGMLLIKNHEAQMVEEGLEFLINVNSCRWAMEQAVLNRNGGTMMAAVIDYVEKVEYRAEQLVRV